MPKKGENIRKRKDGRWEARFIRGIREDGKADICSIYGKSYFEVRQKRLEAIMMNSENSDQKRKVSKEITFDILSVLWLDYVKDTLRVSTHATYSSIIRIHIMPYFKNMLFSDLSQEKIEVFLKKRQLEGRFDGKGLSGTSIILIQNVLIQIIKFGRNQGFHHMDYEISKVAKSRKRIIEIPTSEELTRLEYFLSNNHDPCCFGILLCMYTGIRNGELCSLKWGDIDLENLVIYINKTLQRLPSSDENNSKKTSIVIGVPKSMASIRTIPIPTILLPYVEKYKCPPGYFVLTGTGNCMEPRLLRCRYHKYLSECDIKSYHFHALRHAFATRCMEKGVDVKTLSEILGHTNISTTLEVYTHPSLELKRMYMERLCSPS